MRDLIISPQANIKPDSIILGPWCLGYRNLKLFETAEAQVIKSPADSWEKYSEVNAYLSRVIHQLIDEIGKEGDRLQGKEHSHRYWRIRLVHFLVHFCSESYDIFTRLKALPNVELKVELPMNSGWKTKYLTDFSQEFWTNEFVEVLTSDIIREMKSPNLDIQLVERKLEVKNSGRSNLKLKENLRRLVASVTGIFVTGFDHSNFMGQLKMGVRMKASVRGLPRMSEKLKRRPTLEDEFVQILRKLLPEYLPEECLEKVRAPLRTSDVVGSNLFNSDCTGTVAELAERGARLFQFQHGAGYANYSQFPISEIDFKTPDYFLTWGSKPIENGPENWLPSRPMMPSHFRRARLPTRGERVLLMSNSYPLLAYRFHGTVRPDSNFQYFKDRISIYEQAKEMGLDLTLKPYQSDYGLDEVSYWKRRGAKLDTEKLNWTYLTSNYDLVILDHFGTSLLELAGLNFPFICVWNPDYFALNSLSQHHVQVMKNAGMFYEDYSQALKKAEQLKSNLKSWWMNAECQQAVRSIQLDFFNQANPDYSEGFL